MAVSSQTFSDFGAGVSDVFAGFADFTKAAGAEAEGQAYSEAAALAEQNAKYTKESTNIQVAQAERELLLSTGRTTGEVAGAGFSLSGSALDILRSSAAQGSLKKAVIGQQGLITEAGYEQQAASYRLMASAANDTAKGDNLAAIGSFASAGVSMLAGIASL